MEFLGEHMTAALSYLSQSEAETIRLGQLLAASAKKGDIFALYGTLGMGKSVFSRAFIQHFLGNVDVPSPTFNLLQTYEAPDYEIYHFDLYRLKDPEEIFELGMEEAMYNGVCLIEWPEKMGGYLPKRAITVKITPQEEGRLFEFFTADSACAARLSSINGK